jgi:COMPASS component SWD3
MDGHKNRIHAIRSHPSMETVFLTGGWDETVHYWDERAPHSQKHFAGPHLCGDALDIIEEHDVILTGSWRRNSTLQVKMNEEKKYDFIFIELCVDLGLSKW